MDLQKGAPENITIRSPHDEQRYKRIRNPGHIDKGLELLSCFGGLKPKTYDLELENAIRRNLNLTGLPGSVKFEILLKNLPVEDLIVAFFRLFNPLRR